MCLVHVVPAIPKLPYATAFFHEAEYEKQLHEDAAEELDELAAKIAKSGVPARSDRGNGQRCEHGIAAHRRAQQRGSDRHLPRME